jgi:hypothetical protein
VLVLIEEALHSLFTSFTDSLCFSVGRLSSCFIKVRGIPGTSISYPIVMKPRKLRGSSIPYRGALSEVAQVFGLAPLAISTIVDNEYLLKIKVESKDQQTLFTIDVSRTSAVIKSELVEQPILTDDAIVKYPTRNLLLLHKAEAFLGRKNVKCRDAFDIKILKDSGAELEGNLKFHLQDGVVSDRLEDPDFIKQRITAVTPKRCESELREYLPEDVYRQLAENKFEPLRQSLRDLFAEWLEQ